MRDLRRVDRLPNRAGRHAALIVFCVTLLAGLPAAAGRLSDATSPYLLLHADDAIDWHAWEPETLDRARAADKPIFLSIGYAACHWCHVMARTTFADDRVIDLLNRNFISILVDREERPDLDAHFTTVMSAMVGRTGSPANFVLTPDLVPILAAGYLAPDAEFGEPGLVESLQTVVTAWAEDRNGVTVDAESIRATLQRLAEPIETGSARSGHDTRDEAAQTWIGAFDPVYGGFGGEPKFPFPNVLSFLLHYAVWNGDRAMEANVYKTLDAMAASAVRDQLGGAFHRYAVDRAWRLPHFEIMLEENALLAQVYLDAYRASGAQRYAVVARGILDDLAARLRLPDGGFASSLDAETEQVDGRYYTWTADQISAALGAEAPRFADAYLDPTHSVLRLVEPEASVIDSQQSFADSLARLRAARAERVPPFRDEKRITSWNALAISAFAKAAQIFDEPEYLATAQAAMDGLLESYDDLTDVRRSSLDGRKSGEVFLDDYAFLALALIDLYEADFRRTRLDLATSVMEIVLNRFAPVSDTPLRFSPHDAKHAVGPIVILEEQGSPSGNAASLMALYRLNLYGAESRFARPADALARSFGRYLEMRAAGATGLLRAFDFRSDEAHEIVIVGELEDDATRALLLEVRTRLLHGTVVAVIPPGAPLIDEQWPLLSGRPLLDGKPTAYVCRKRLCNFPVNAPADLISQLDQVIRRNLKARTAR